LNLTLQIFKQIPPLWIWDNIEPVNGFPRGTQSSWSDKEQRELKMFLQIVTGQSKAKFLLTSRRDEQAWLGDLPRRVALPPMPVQERVQLARALADKLGKRITDVKDWMPLLRFTQGNPLTVTVIVGQALRDGISTPTQIEEYLGKLHSGEQAFTDETSEKRERSLAASLNYGFEQAFTEDERKVLALLYLFQGFVDVDALWIMGDEKAEWCLPEVRSLTRETGIALLDKASEIGLLTSHGGGYYTIHPALPWFFRSLFEQYYPKEVPALDENATEDRSLNPDYWHATRAYVEAMGELGNYYFNQYEEGSRGVIAPLRAEESNLLHARSLARRHGWYWRITSTMQGLRQLYDHTGRYAEWKRLVEEIVPDFVGADDRPLPGREEQWSLITEYLVSLARESRDWAEAERLQRRQVDEQRRRAAPLLRRPADELTAAENNALRSLAVSLQVLGHLQSQSGKIECVSTYEEGYELSLRIGDQSVAVTAFNLGHAYKDLPALRNLDEAERWYRRSLELRPEGDYSGRARSLGQLGFVSYERFKDALKEGKTNEGLLKHLNIALDLYQQALALLPPDAVNDLAVTHNQLGNIYAQAGNVERAIYHWNQDIHYDELAGNQFGAGQTRFNIALLLAEDGRLSDALLYARAALRNFESYEGRAKDREDRTKELIAEIERGMEAGKK
ncbi:MAG TPA: hypothetical protein VNJ09_07875, partial [Chthonomonadales bacterium]|nr:hypothetical protein [Chthonomonadales bacterium]